MTAWDTIVREQGPAVWRTAYRLLGDRSDADDCMQEVFVAAVGIARRTSVQNWPALLQRLAVLRGIDGIRRRGRERLRSAGPAGLAGLPSTGPGPAQAAQAGELAAALRAALAQLPLQQAQVVALRYMNDLDYQEISNELNLSVRHVGVILSRAREKLREMLKEKATDHGG